MEDEEPRLGEPVYELVDAHHPRAAQGEFFE